MQLWRKYRLARMLEREEISPARDEPADLGTNWSTLLLTAVDAVKLEADVELGATEQKFNLLVHREIQRPSPGPRRGRADHADPGGHRRAAEDVRQPGELPASASRRAICSARSCRFPTSWSWSYYELEHRSFAGTPCRPAICAHGRAAPDGREDAAGAHDSGDVPRRRGREESGR